MNAKQALELTERFQLALSLLVIHGLVSDGEREKVRQRLDKWAVRHGLTYHRNSQRRARGG